MDLEKRRAYNAAWRASHPEKVRAYNAKRYVEHRAELLSSSAKWKAAHRAERRAYHTKWYKENRIKQLAYRMERRDEIRAYHAAYNAEHYEEIRAYSTNRAHRKRANGGRFTHASWEYLKVIFGHQCAYCHRRMERLTQDHIVPVSKGGWHVSMNIVPACQSCNSSKHDRLTWAAQAT